MSRISDVLSHRSGKLLIPFFTAGYPDFKTSLEYAKVATEAGADMIELGVPFSDPLADGPQIQYSSFCALQKGISLKAILQGVQGLRSSIDTPFILMGYYNPIHVFGLNSFMKQASKSAVDGLIVPDLPFDEAVSYSKEMDRNKLSSVFLVAPTSSKARIKKIDEFSTDFVYAVTVAGVTGTGKVFSKVTDIYLEQLGRLLKKPFVAGFGVSDPKSAKRLCRYAEGVVIGSAFVNIVKESRTKRQSIVNVGRFVNRIRKAI